MLWLAACAEPADTLTLTLRIGQDPAATPTDTLPLVRGPQGLQHIDLSLHAPFDFDELLVPRASLTLTLTSAEGVALAPPHRAGYALHPVDSGVTVDAIRYVIAEPEDLIGVEARLEALLEPVGSLVVARGQTHGVVRWWRDDPTNAPLSDAGYP